MANSPSVFPDVLLVELMNPETGEIVDTDVTAKLELAVEKVYQHTHQISALVGDVDVSYDDEELEGLAFFNDEQEMLACITVYRLERDTGSAQLPALSEACCADKADLKQRLTTLFSD